MSNKSRVHEIVIQGNRKRDRKRNKYQKRKQHGPPL